MKTSDWRRSGTESVSYLAVAVLVSLLWAGRSACANGAPPLFARVAVLEAEDGGGPFDVSVRISVIHRPPWYPGFAVSANNVPLGEVSEWLDLSAGLPDGKDEATGSVSISQAGKPLTGRVRLRLELARSATATTPIASKVIEDPAGKLGFVIPERGVADVEVPQRLRTIAEVAQRHLDATADFGLTREEMPKKLVTMTACIISDLYSDPQIAKNEVETLLRLGYNTLSHVPLKMGKEFGVPYFEMAEHRPPDTLDEQLAAQHYAGGADELRRVFGSADRLRGFAISDEPHWYFPSTSDALNKDTAILERFRKYVQDKGFSPADLGKASWEEVTLLGSPAGKNASLAERRLWYCSVRFVGYDDSCRYAVATRALRAAYGDQILGFTNWNRPGIFYDDPSGWANTEVLNASHDWFEFSRLGGGTCLWLGPGIEEGRGWYRSTFRVWSMMLNLLRSAANEGPGHFGAYIHHGGPIAEERGHEVELSIMALAGYGGSGYNSWIWGPHHAFTERMWSEKFGHYDDVADANRLIGKSEDFLVGATPPEAEVALLWPATSQLYDLNKGGYRTYNRDFLVEVEHVWLALNRRGIPVEFLDEVMVQRGDLDKYRVLYITGPNLESKTAETIREWVGHGGHLWTCAGAGVRDEYDLPMTVLDEVLGVESRKAEKVETDYSPKGGLRNLAPIGQVKIDPAAGLGAEPWNAYGSRASFQVTTGKVIGRFDNGEPAVVRNDYGSGASLYFATMPGLAYGRGATEVDWVPTTDYPPRIADLITNLPKELGIRAPVKTSLPFVEAVLLRSDKGMAVTLLNWSGKPLANLKVTIRDLPEVKSIRSARLGDLEYRREGNSISMRLPMPRVADVLLVEIGAK